MSTIKDLKKLVARNKVGEVLEQALALAEKHELEDLENSFIGLQARQTSVEEAENDGIMDPRDINMEKAKIRKSTNFFLDKLEEELPAEPEPETEPNGGEELKKSLEKRITHLIKKITHLNNEVITESNPGTKFDIQADIDELHKELKATKEQLESLG